MTQPKRSSRGLAAVVATTLAVTGVTACAGSEEQETPAAGAEAKPKVGLVIINQEAVFFKELIRGAKKAAADNNVELAITNANNDPAAQNTAMENYTQQNLDAIIVNPIDADGIKPAIKTAKDAGVQVVAVDAVLNDPNVATEVGTDNLASGRQMGEFINQFAGEEGEKLSIGQVAALNSSVQIDRQKDFETVVERGGHDLTQVVDGKNVQETALQAAEDLITSQGSKMDTVYATGEPALIGTVAAARSQKATSRLNVFGWDLTADSIKGIDDGFVKGVVQQDPYTEGVRGVEAAVQIAKGQTPPRKIKVPITIVTKENVDPYRKLFR